MRPQTQTLRREISSLNPKESISLLHNAYQSETCYLIACGPSTGEFQSEELRSKLQDKLVVTVKQAYSLLEGVSDFHIYNLYNYDPINYVDPRPIVMATDHDGYRKPEHFYSDICLNLINVGDFSKSLAAHRQFDEFLLENRLDRCFGPGIVFELGFYLAVHLGVKRIVTLGYDEGGSEHFYDSIWRKIKKRIRNRDRCETGLALAAVDPWVEWLHKRGISWERVQSRSRTGMPKVATTTF